MRIPMANLKLEYDSLKDQILKEVASVLDSTAFINGDPIKEFDKKVEDFLKVKHHIPCGNGTDALQIALMSLGIHPGDEIITTPFTFIATAEVIALLKAKPVFVDIDPDTLLIDVNKIEEAITDKTFAILPVHLFGQMANMDAIMKIAKKHDLKVVEDAAQAFGATHNGTIAGTIGDIGTISYFPSKNLGAYGDAGGIITNNDDLAAKIKMIVNHGQNKKYEHHLIGVNSRMDTIQAAILNVKIKYINEWLKKRNAAGELYKKLLDPSIKTQTTTKGNFHTYHQFTIKYQNRDKLKKYLADKEIASAIYYPIPLNEQKAFENKFDYNKTPNSNKVAKEVLSLPISHFISENEIKEVSEAVNSFI
ncbi:MAG: DegT/DnrJ/EryC1/StrS family aminotransferase [Candidatus Marinimicrobia bacterium]|nr:DegT/DnrJ/EryC1/StrS family aminotransferase [Candidatus Neomarinimicrobiota bacterium]